MSNPLKKLIERYTNLEREVQKLVREQCIGLCKQCTQHCCATMICEEAIESPFLKMVHQQTDRFSHQYGFLSDTGCILPFGRPPVCYEYFCEDLIYLQPDEAHEKALRTLGALPNHSLRNALGETPLTEIMKEADFGKVDFQRLEKQLDESFLALEVIQTFYKEGTLPDEADRVLERIQFAPED